MVQGIYKLHADNTNSKGFHSQPTLFEVICVVLAQATIFVLELSRWGILSIRFADEYDCGKYRNTAEIIRHWNPAVGGAYTYRHLLGFPSAIALVSTLFAISDKMSLGLISGISVAVTVLLINRLYGGSVSLWFLILSIGWVQIVVLGAREPLFLSFWLGAFWFARQSKWNLASLLAGLSATVAPEGLFSVLALTGVLLWHRKWPELLNTIFMTAIIASLYLLGAHKLTGDPSFGFKSGGVGAETSDSLFSLYLAIEAWRVSSREIMSRPPLTSWAINAIWTTLLTSVLALIMWLGKRRTALLITYPVEYVSCSLLLIFFICYNCEFNTFREWPRLALPIIPFFLYGAVKDLPTNRRLTWPLAILSALLGSVGILFFKDVFGFHLYSIVGTLLNRPPH